MDPATRRNLELTETMRGEPAPTLFSLLDTCATGMGSRLLRHALHHPLRDRAVLAARHDAVAALIGDGAQRPARALHEHAQAMRGRRAHRGAHRAASPRGRATSSGLRDTLERLPRARRSARALAERRGSPSSRDALAPQRRRSARCSTPRSRPSRRRCCAKAA